MIGNPFFKMPVKVREMFAYGSLADLAIHGKKLLCPLLSMPFNLLLDCHGETIFRF